MTYNIIYLEEGKKKLYIYTKFQIFKEMNKDNIY